MSAQTPTLSENCDYRPRAQRSNHWRLAHGRSRTGYFRAIMIVSALWLGGLFGSASASADSSTTSVVTVHHVNVNPQTPSAAMHTLNQLKDAAVEACGASPFSLSEYKAAVRETRCWHDSVADVVARLGSAQLALAFEAMAERHASHLLSREEGTGE
jgi:UrcA family protein